MDNEQNIDTYTMDGALVLHSGEKEALENPADVLVRRLKNRERQRRYRARKRQEANLRKASPNVDPSTSLYYQQTTPTSEFLTTPVEVKISLNATPPDYLTRVHCKRDWKKDARKVHVQKKRELSPIDPINEDLQSSHSNTSSSKRHWKAEARNKKTSD